MSISPLNSYYFLSSDCIVLILYALNQNPHLCGRKHTAQVISLLESFISLLKCFSLFKWVHHVDNYCNYFCWQYEMMTNDTNHNNRKEAH